MRVQDGEEVGGLPGPGRVPKRGGPDNDLPGKIVVVEF